MTKCNFIEAKMFPEGHIGFNEVFKGKFSAVQGSLVTSNEKEREKEMILKPQLLYWKKFLFDKIPFSKEYLWLFQCGTETKFKVLKVLLFLPSSLLHVMSFTENHHFQDTISVCGSVEPASYAVGCLLTHRTICVLIPVTRN